MARRDLADVLLQSWGDWVSRCGDSGAGMPRRSAFTRTAVRMGAQATVPIGDLSAAKIGEQMQALLQQNPSAWLVAHCYYVGNPALSPAQRRPLPMTDCARLAHCALSTAYAHLRFAKHMVEQKGVLLIRKNR